MKVTSAQDRPGGGDGRAGRVLRVGWALLSLFVVESAVFGMSVFPAVAFYEFLYYQWRAPVFWLRPVMLAMWFVAAYLVFAVILMSLSAGATRLLGWRTPAGVEMPLREMGWPLLRWARYAAVTHAVRLLVGLAFRGTPLWTFYMRLNGARLGRGVYVNSLEVMDHNLLDFGDGVVIGANVHISGHTVESGVVKTAPVRLGRGVTVGLSSVVGIGVEIGDRGQVGALSLVPKHRKLEGGMVWAGIPVQPLQRDRPDDAQERSGFQG